MFRQNDKSKQTKFIHSPLRYCKDKSVILLQLQSCKTSYLEQLDKLMIPTSVTFRLDDKSKVIRFLL